ncbi:MAG TPA: MCE family protein [Acidimicrobiales bacterium]|nr:MCE family protein [Acidimicrobiales bacterium]
MPRIMNTVARHRVVGAALALAVVTGGFSPARQSSNDTYRLTAFFTKGISLYEGGDVRVLGLPAGEVTEVAVDGARVRVELTLRGDVPVPADVQATIVPFSLIGERYIQLFPAWVAGQAKAADGTVLGLDRTSVPVEPDEALQALKDFLESLDPSATGRLVTNLADDLDGNGERLNEALSGLADVASTFAEKDEELVSIIDHFDVFTSTLRTRETQLGQIMDSFAATTAVLANERRDIERLVKGLARLSSDGVDLVAQHGTRLERDIEILTRTLKSASTHIDGVRQLLDATPVLVAGPAFDGRRGLAGAWDPKHHDLDLRNSSSPTVGQALDAIGLPTNVVCLPLDVQCTTSASAAPSGASARSASDSTPTTASPPSLSPSAAPPGRKATASQRVARAPARRSLSATAERSGTGWFGRLVRSIGEVVA